MTEGFVASLALPGGNVTGLTSLIPGLAQKYVELLREVVPSATRLAIVGIPPQPIPVLRREIEAAGRTLGISIIFVQPSGSSDFDRAHAEAKEAGAAGIIHPLDGATYVHRAALAQAALKNKLPGIADRLIE